MYADISSLPVTIESVSLELLEEDTSSDFTRTTTELTLEGDGERGVGEDVIYTAEHQYELPDLIDDIAVTGSFTFGGYSDRIGDRDLFAGTTPDRDDFRHYRRWAFESAALDLALKQDDLSFAEALDREYDPVRFVVSTRLGDPPTIDRVRGWLDIDTSLEFKLDPTTDWSPDLIEALAATGAVRILDFKEHYDDDELTAGSSPEFYQKIIDRFPGVIIEDPQTASDITSLLKDPEQFVSWDAPITDKESIESLPFTPSHINIKPSRFGSVQSLLDTIEYCLRENISLYGGGQFELSAGRDHIQALASLFYPDSPNDVAPRPYNAPKPHPDVPPSPLEPPTNARGFQWS